LWLRLTVRRGLAGDPKTFLRMCRLRRNRPVIFFSSLFMACYRHSADPKALPAFFTTFSSWYRIPLPL